ncbi:MAG TPA: hypothetical protein VKV26_16925 [Dehalococcoidia bacterium]|nr:hypothetical protein [Dehalococcoidia bacterium]
MSETTAQSETEAQASAALLGLISGFEVTAALRAVAELGIRRPDGRGSGHRPRPRQSDRGA